MTDLQSAARAPLVQAPISWVARELLASDSSVQAVMVMRDDGRVLAHERAMEHDETDPFEEEDNSLLFYAPEPGLLFFIRLSKQPVDAVIPSRIESIVGSPSFAITR